jgi:hypothetical protein
MFDLHITTTRDGFHAAAYIVPWEQLPEKSQYLDKKVIKTDWAEMEDYLKACENDGATP